VPRLCHFWSPQLRDVRYPARPATIDLGLRRATTTLGYAWRFQPADFGTTPDHHVRTRDGTSHRHDRRARRREPRDREMLLRASTPLIYRDEPGRFTSLVITVL
jgi:hypothetical protein